MASLVVIQGSFNLSRDTIFRDRPTEGKPFRFDAAVAAVFPDMLKRSIPGYARTLDIVGRLAAQHVTAGSRVYDLGCSLGAAALAVSQAVSAVDCEIIGVDTSAPMLEKATQIAAAEAPDANLTFINADVAEVAISNASLVILNYTLQFVVPEKRDALLKTIHGGLAPGGVLLLSEKIAFPAGRASETIIALHEDFKRDQGYSEMEIAGKRQAIENVLIPDTAEKLEERLLAVGFRDTGQWLQHYNFCSYVAFRDS